MSLLSLWRWDFWCCRLGLERGWNGNVADWIGFFMFSFLEWVAGTRDGWREFRERRFLAHHTKNPPGAYVALGFESSGAWGRSASRFLRQRYDFLNDAKLIRDRRTWFWITQDIGKTIRTVNSFYLNTVRNW